MLGFTSDTGTVGTSILTLLALPTLVETEVADFTSTGKVVLVRVNARKALRRTSVKLPIHKNHLLFFSSS